MEEPQPSNDQKDTTSIPVMSSDDTAVSAPAPSEPEAAPSSTESTSTTMATEPAAPVVGNDFATSASPSVLGNAPTPEPAPVEEPTPEPPSPSEPSAATSEPMAEPPKDDIMPDLANESDTPPTDAPKFADTPLAAAGVVPSASEAIKKKGTGMGLIIAIVILVVAVLAAVGYFAFLKKDDSSATKSGTTAATSDTTVSATPDNTSTTIDDSLAKLDDTKDFSSTDLNDTTLGL